MLDFVTLWLALNIVGPLMAAAAVAAGVAVFRLLHWVQPVRRTRN